MKKYLLSICLMFLSSASLMAQDETKHLTTYREFRPAVVHMGNGNTVRTSLANIFLKNASLLFMRGSNTMEANMSTIASVDFDNQHYVNIDNMLALELDSIGENRLYCATVIDVEAYQAMLRNNVNISNLSLGDQISYSTVNLTPDDGLMLPLVPHYYYLYKGEIIKVHEREISRRLPKDKKRQYKTIISLPDFTWVDAESLVKLLKAISD